MTRVCKKLHWSKFLSSAWYLNKQFLSGYCLCPTLILIIDFAKVRNYSSFFLNWQVKSLQQWWFEHEKWQTKKFASKMHFCSTAHIRFRKWCLRYSTGRVGQKLYRRADDASSLAHTYQTIACGIGCFIV